jgi:deoxyhypusine synthase
MAENVIENVFVVSNEVPTTSRVRGYDFNLGVQWEELMASYNTTGFQGTHLSQAIDEINRMVRILVICVVWFFGALYALHLCFSDQLEVRLATVKNNESGEDAPGCRIFLGYTSNMVSSGLREVIRFLVQHKMVSLNIFLACCHCVYVYVHVRGKVSCEFRTNHHFLVFSDRLSGNIRWRNRRGFHQVPC